MMTGLLFKWLLMPFVWFSSGQNDYMHPVYTSVTEIEHNAKTNTLEVSCKIFTDDFEKTLRKVYKTKIDLENEKMKPAMDSLVNDYVKKHLSISTNGKQVRLQFLGFERIEEGIYSYYEAENVSPFKRMVIKNNLLFEYKKEQMNFIHVTAAGKRKSTKLNNPESIAEFNF